MNAAPRLLLLILALGGATRLQAQDSLMFEDDSRLRVTAREFGLQREIGVGKIRGSSADTLLFRYGGITTGIPLRAVETLELGESVRWNGGNAAIGAAVGLAIGFAIGATGDCSGIFDRSDCIALGTVLLGVPAAAIGVVFGGLSGGERWRPLPISQRATPAQARRLPAP